MDMQTCVGSGLPRLVWLFSMYGVLVTVNAGGGNGTCAEELCDPLVAWLSEMSAGDENTGGQVSDQAGTFGTCLWATPSPSFLLRESSR